jgi:hypothetical protein
VDVGVVLARYLVTLLPFTPVMPTFNVGSLLSDGALLLLLAVGWRNYRHSQNEGRAIRPLLGFALLLPLLGVISYLPWPSFQEFYALPYLVGTAVLIAFAVSGFELLGRSPATLGTILAGVPLLFMLTSAQYSAGRSRASTALAHEVTELLTNGTNGDTVVFAVRGLPPRQWFGLSATLARQATVNGTSFPPVIELACPDAKERFERSKHSLTMVAFHSHCDPIGPAQRQVVVSFSWFDWARGRVVRDSASADVFRTY